MSERTEAEKPLRCPYCGGPLQIELETVGQAYLTYERPESIECEACGSRWEPDGTPRDVPNYAPDVAIRPASTLRQDSPEAPKP